MKTAFLNEAAGVRPVYRHVIPEAIPAELKAIPQWVVWKARLIGGKWTKPPADAKTGRDASTKNSSTWADFETALRAYQTGSYDGIGLVLTDNLSLVGFDFDHVVNGGEIAPEVAAILKKLRTYAEFSPTDGIRALAFGRKPGPRCKLPSKGYEIYSEERYLTITGNAVNGFGRIERRQKEIEALYSALFPKEETSTKERGPSSSVDMSDHELLERAFSSTHGAQIQALYNGDTSAHSNDDSAADLAFCNHLAFWTGRDAARMDAIFRTSGLMREKWNERRGKTTYGEWTISKAIAGCARVYEAGGGRAEEKEPPPEQGEQPADQDGADAEKKRIIEEMNRHHAVVMLGGKCRIMREYFDPLFGRQDIAFSAPPDFHAFFANKLFRRGEDEKPVSYSKLWFTSKHRRQYDGIGLFPPSKSSRAKAPKTYYNLWRGFGIKPKRGDWSLFEDHIFSNVCGGNQDHFRWLMSWVARIVQDPGGERPGTAVVLIGRRGTGKSTFAEMLRPIFDRHFLQLSNQKHLTGNFNSHLKDKLVLFCDEGFWGGSKADEGVLKALITEPTIPIEAKGQDVIEMKNHINLIMATNNEWVIPAGLEERRFFVLEVADSHLQDQKYFGPLRRQMNSGGAEAFLYDLLEWNDPSVNLREAPKTEALLSQIECSMSPLQKWWYQRLSDGENQEGTGQWYHEIEKQKLYQDYLNFAAKIGRASFLSDIQFGKRLKKISPSVSRRRDNIGSRPWLYCFNDLETHRKEFQDILRFRLNW